MSDERVYEIEIRVRDAKEETVKHLEGPLSHKTVKDIVVDLANTLNTRSGGKMRAIDAAR